MEELLGEFIAETLETLQNLSGEVVAWENDPSDRDRLDSLFRFFHTVKGSCGFLDLPRFEKLSHAAEDVLAAIRDGKRAADPETVTAVLAVMDRIGEMAHALADGNALPHEAEDDALVAALMLALSPTAAARAPRKLASPASDSPPAPELDRQQPARRDNTHRTVRVSLSLIDQLMNGVSDMVLARNELARKLRDSALDAELEGSFERLSTCVADMRDIVSKTRMQRVDRLFAAVPRVVRDLSLELGKKVELTIEGGDVEMDREMIEMVVDPLTHIVRNALDHGLESPAERIAAGKDETGRIRIAARQSGNQIVIQVLDNGRGIDPDILVEKAVRLGLLAERQAAAMTEEERLDLIFLPGLTTAPQVSAISGRGVGMDVVRNNVERIGGVVTIETTLGRGTHVQMRVPMTLTIISGLILHCGSEMFAMPRGNVIELLHDNSAMVEIDCAGGARIATIRGTRHALVDLRDLLGQPPAPADGPKRTLMLIRASTGMPYALAVDAVENHEELVIRPASPPVMAAGIFAGMTLPDNGRPMLLLDAAGIAAVAQLPPVLEQETLHASPARATAEAAEPTIQALQFVEVGGQHRLIALDIIERIEDIPAEDFGSTEGERFVRLNGRLIPVANAARPEAALFKTLHLRAGDGEFCYVVDDVVDIIDMPVRPHLVVRRDGISGIVTHGGQHLEVIDAHSLFARLEGQRARDQRRGLCLVEGLASDPWMRTILAPLLAQSGYDVRDAGAVNETGAGGPFVLLCGDDRQMPVAAVGESHVIRLRAKAEGEAGPADGSIYRYDRAALLAAIDDLLRSQAA